MSAKVQICEVAPRDGLQSLDKTLTVDQRVEFCDRLIQAGLTKIEVGSLVDPKVVPAMAKSQEVYIALKKKHPSVQLGLLVPNEHGLNRALSLKANYISFFTATSETFNKKNINRSVANSIREIAEMAVEARNRDIGCLRLYISTIFDCAYEGTLDATQDLPHFEFLFSLFDEISLGDTTGKGEPQQMQNLLTFLQKKRYKNKIWWHFHDTYNKAGELAQLALAQGYHKFDSSANGIGGCPFSPGAKGNIATDKILVLAEKAGFKHDIQLDLLQKAGDGFI